MKIATFDIETDGLLHDMTRLHCAVVRDHDGTSVFFTSDPLIHPGRPLIELGAFLDTFDVLIGHNCIDFDFAALRLLYGYEYKGRVYDTLVISRLQDPFRSIPRGCPSSAGPHSVEAWGWRLGRGKVEYKEWRTFTPTLAHRCIEDTEIQYMIWQALAEERAASGYTWMPAIQLSCTLFRRLKQQEEYGWTVDIEHLHRSLAMLNRWKDRIDRVVTPLLPRVVEPLETKKDGEYNYVRKPFKKDGSYSAVTERWLDGLDSGDAFRSSVRCVGGVFSRVHIRPVDLNKTVEVKDVLLSLGWVPKEWNLDHQGNRSSPKMSKDDPFVGIQSKMGKLIARRVQIRQRLGILEGWMDHVRPDGRISTTHSGLTTTARLRHSGVVNVPSPDSGAFFAKSMRRVFIAKPGWKMVGVDSKGNQQRQLVNRLGMDVSHPFAQGVLYGKKEEGTDEHSVNQKMANLPNRTLAKNLFYGTVFGARDKKISQTLKCSLEEASDYRARILNVVEGLPALIDRLTKEWRATAERVYNPQYGRMEFKNGRITGLDGRPIWVESEHMLVVYLVQSDEAIQMAVAYCWFYSQMEKRGYVFGKDWGMLIWYHDEYQFECRPELAEELAAIAEESVAWAGKFLKINTPHEGEAKIGFNWSETH